MAAAARPQAGPGARQRAPPVLGPGAAGNAGHRPAGVGRGLLGTQHGCTGPVRHGHRAACVRRGHDGDGVHHHEPDRHHGLHRAGIEDPETVRLAAALPCDQCDRLRRALVGHVGAGGGGFRWLGSCGSRGRHAGVDHLEPGAGYRRLSGDGGRPPLATHPPAADGHRLGGKRGHPPRTCAVGGDRTLRARVSGPCLTLPACTPSTSTWIASTWNSTSC